MQRLKEKIAVLLFALALAAPAAAHVPPIAISPAIDRASFNLASSARPATSEVLPLVEQLRSAARAAWPHESLPKTRVWGSEVLAPFERQPVSGLSRALRQGYAKAERENAEGGGDYEIRSLYLAASEESKTKLLTGFHAAPYVEPATGMVLFRDRWYDPSTGTWLTPDAEGYAAGSSNLYAGFLNDPVNHRDPTGNEPITAAAVIAYLGNVVVQTAVDVGIDYAWHEGVDWWNGTDTEFDWHDSLQTNFSVNLISGGFGGKFKHLAKLRNPVLRGLAKQGVEYAVDVAATGTVDMVLHDQSAKEAFGTAAIGGLIGRTAGHGLRHGSGILGRYAGFRRGRGEFLEEVNEALARRRGEDVFTTQRANRTGFDLGAYADGATFLDEVKFYSGTVRHNDVTSAGLHFAQGRASAKALSRNVRTAGSGAINAGQLDAARLLRDDQFHLRLVGGPRTMFDPYIGDALAARGISHSFHRISRPQIWSYVWLGY